jgi:hypothetical protein
MSLIISVNVYQPEEIYLYEKVYLYEDAYLSKDVYQYEDVYLSSTIMERDHNTLSHSVLWSLYLSIIND